jgi:cysteine-rich repeat protein
MTRFTAQFWALVSVVIAATACTEVVNPGTGGMGGSPSTSSHGSGSATGGATGGATAGSGGSATVGSATSTASIASGTGGMGITCTIADGCPGMDTQCLLRSCVAGLCGFTPVPSGTPIPTQIPGDCATAVCDGNGGEALVPDDTDVLDDSNACTADACSLGMPVNTPVPAGTACAQGGGKVCDGQISCVECLVAADCSGGAQCALNQCVPTTCTNGAHDGTETDVDCGGVCAPCADGLHCGVSADCQSGVCQTGPMTCSAPACGDGVKNGPETDVDCGGLGCIPCGPGLGCAKNSDCTGGQCSGTLCLPTCSDHVTNQGETDVDCGGPTCAKCAAGKACAAGADCQSGVCTGNVCQAAKCNDGVKNGSETDVDCGGSCGPCGPTQGCGVPADCQSGVCAGKVCQAAACNDGVKNGLETDVDCGGADCFKCGVGKACMIPADCGSSVCTGGLCQLAKCGDGVKLGGEACDDGNTAGGDGCSATCTLEPGYNCAGAPSVCTPICGDGIKTPTEGCDDGAHVNGDGCSATCAIEPGYSCTGSPSMCAAGCGDGLVIGGELCDDGNLTSGDGCSAGCAVEPGFHCAGAPSMCTTTCGDGLVGGAEQCDDGNLTSGDGCSPTCAKEAGYTCAGAPSVCHPTCGDGVVVGAEQCDDGNATSGDGCSATCAKEAGYTCTGMPSTCVSACGDGVKASGEQCDDGNTVGGDCCSAGCAIEAGCEVEPNDTFATANDFAALAVANRINGFIRPAGELDVYVLHVPQGSTGTLTAQTLDNFVGGTCASNTLDTVVSIFDSAQQLLVSDDNAGGNKCSKAIATTLAPGAYYVQVKAASAGATFAYTLSVTLQLAPCGNGALEAGEQCDDGNLVNGDGCSSACRIEPKPEVEGNDTCGAANGPYPLPPSRLFSGSISTGGDVDWYAFTVARYADVRLETFDAGGPGNCAIDVDTEIQLFRGDCVTAQSAPQDQGGLNNCSRLDPASDASVRKLPPGTYYVSVQSPFGGLTFDYTLQMTLVADCGNGVTEGSEQCDGGANCAADCTIIQGCGDGVRQSGEQCDDGNMLAGDGCSASCTWETTAEVEPNDTVAAAHAGPIHLTGSANLTGAIGAVNDLDLFELVVAAPTTLRLEVFDPSGSDCATGITSAMLLKLLDGTGTLLKQDTPTGDVTASGIGLYCPALIASVAAGTYYVQVQAKSAATLIAAYFLQVRFEASTGSEVEPNDVNAMATPDPGADTAILGDHQMLGDVDVYQITIPAGVSRSIRAEVIESDAGKACDLKQIDSFLTLYDGTGTLLASDDDSGRGYCSAIDGTGSAPRNPSAHNLAPGTYYLEVKAAAGATMATGVFNYKLAVTVRQ